MSARAGRDRGIALIAAVWWTLIVSMLALGVARETRTVVKIAANEVIAAETRAAAEAGITALTLALAAEARGRAAPLSSPARSRAHPPLAGDVPLALDGRPYSWAFQGAELTLSARAERGKYDLNTGDPALLRPLLAAADIADPERVAADILAERRRGRDGRSISWRLGDQGFDGVGELAGLPSLSRDAFER
ncbi:MAG: hypothetical protein MI723_19075, partial [Caulobacterales bacterium]|nr:hypothetical protein [Caulobacterales bacterium]